MSTTRHIGRIGTRTTASIGVSLLAVLATVVLLAMSTVSSAVKLSANSTALLVCGATCPTWRDGDVEAIMNQFITPTHPGQTITPVAVTTLGESWPITGILRLAGVAVGDPSFFGPGGGAWPDEPWWKLSGLFDLTADQSIQAGAANLEAAMAANGNDHLVIYGYSQGAAVVSVVKKRLAAQYPVGTQAPDIDFVLGGDFNVPNGGLFARFPGLYIPILDWTFSGPEPTDTQFDTVVINRQYDGVADFPLYPLNVIADLNAILGFLYVHSWPFAVSLPADPTKSPAYQGTHGDSSYYLFPTEDLPLFGPLRSLGVPEPLIDVVEPVFRVLVELGYDRSIPPWEPTPARLIPRLDPAKVITDLVHAIGEGVNNALALGGLGPRLGTPAPVTPAAPATEGVQPTGVQPGISQQMTSTLPSRTEKLTSTEPATKTRPDRSTQNGRESTNTTLSTSDVTGTETDEVPLGQKASGDPSTSGVASTSDRASISDRVKPDWRPVTPRSVVRDSLGETEQSRGLRHRDNSRATSTTADTDVDRPTDEASSSAGDASDCAD